MNKEQLSDVIRQLKRNNFQVFFAGNCREAKKIFEEQVLPVIEFKSVSFADSMTMKKTGVLELLRDRKDIRFIDTFNPDDPRPERIEKRRQALLSDLFLTGTNAITEKGQLVNLDMVGNRVAAITFGPRNVVLFIGRNKIVKDLDAAFDRIRTIAAPQNAARHPDFKTPCQQTGTCHDCHNPQRICNSWSITEKSYPPQRIRIILINEDLGL